MKKYFLFPALALLATVYSAFAASPPSVLMLIAREGSERMDLMLSKEVKVMKELMLEAGMQVEIASLTGEPLVGKKERLDVDLRTAEIELDSYSGVMIPCLAPPSPTVHKDILALVERAAAKGMPLGAQRASIEVLALAGALKGKGHASGRGALGSTGGRVLGRGVFRDGNVITSSVCPWYAMEGLKDGTAELTSRFIEMAKEYGSSENQP